MLPIPDTPHTGFVTYDTKDPDTAFPPIVPLRPPAGAWGDHGRKLDATTRVEEAGTARNLGLL